MTDIIEFLLLLFIAVLLSHLCTALYKRLFLLRKLRGLEKIEGVSITRLQNPFISLFRFSKTAEFSVNIYGDTYLVRVYNGGSNTKAVHFANERFSVCYSRIKSVTYTARGRFLNVKGFNFGGSVKIIEPLPPNSVPTVKECTEVILFNPAPGEVSFVVKEKNSIRAAFTGDTVCGRKIFTASTFEIFVDREARRIRDARRRGVWEE